MPETAQQMDIARWSGVSAFGSPRSLTGRMIVDGIASTIVFQLPNGSNKEMTVVSGTTITVSDPPSLPRPLGPSSGIVFGERNIVSPCLWMRADGQTKLTLARTSDGAKVDLSAAAGAITAAAGALIDDRAENFVRFGPEVVGTASRVWVRGMPGKPSGFILQDATGLPWVTWVDASTTLRVTDWSTFLLGLLVATGATAGIPGSFTPAGSAARANLAAMTGITASPATAWTTGQFVALLDGSNAYWNGTAWTAGKAP